MQVTYTETKNTFTSFYDMVIDRREPLYIQRRGFEDLVLLPAIELEALNETAYLLRSPKNAKRLLDALQSSFDNQGEEQTIEELKREVGFE